MVDMGVGKDEIVDRGWIEAKVTVPIVGIGTHALKHATIEKDSAARPQAE